ncbi:MAG: hypothetical protein J4N95_01635 [Chloroflexi bacterium]|nr:hypothetical protein [Chloroflexota bacterium]
MWRLGAFLLLCTSLAIGVACSDGGEEAGDPTPQITPTEATLEPTEVRPESEGGEAPIFWRTADDFASVRAGESYKVLLRITGGYDEETILLVAVRKGDGGEIQITSNRAEPVGEELPGSYYPTFLMLSEPGTWELTIIAGEDEASVQFEVAEPAG